MCICVRGGGGAGSLSELVIYISSLPFPIMGTGLGAVPVKQQVTHRAAEKQVGGVLRLAECLDRKNLESAERLRLFG